MNQPLLLARDADDLLMEVHPILAEDETDWLGWFAAAAGAGAGLAGKRQGAY